MPAKSKFECKLDRGDLNVGEAVHQQRRIRRDGRAEVKKRRAELVEQIQILKDQIAECDDLAEQQVGRARRRLSPKKAKAAAKGGRRRWEIRQEQQDAVAADLEVREPRMLGVWEKMKNRPDWWDKKKRATPTELFTDWIHDNREDAEAWAADLAEEEAETEFAAQYEKYSRENAGEFDQQLADELADVPF